jgi:hypothetical protein
MALIPHRRHLGTTPPAQPPSKYAIDALVLGEPGALQRVAGLTLLRSAIIAPGLYAAGYVFQEPGLRGPKLIGSSLLASATVTLGMLGYSFVKHRVFGATAEEAHQPGVIDAYGEAVSEGGTR